MEGPLPRHPIPPGSSPFPSLPFLTDAYFPTPQCAAAAQQLVLQATHSDQASAAAGLDRLSAVGALQGWGDPSGAAALHLLGAPRDGDAGDLLSAVQDPSAFAASYFGSYLCSPSNFSTENSTGAGSRSFSPVHLAASPEMGSSSLMGAIPPGGFALCYGPSFPFSCPNPLSCGVSQEVPMGAPNTGTAQTQQKPTQDTKVFASDYDRLTKELGKYCASLRDLVTDNPSFADELNSTLETAIHSAGQVARVQRKLLLSARQQKHLVADSKLIHSKVHMLHRILQRTAPQYSQWLEEHAALRDHIKQLEQQYRDPVGNGNLLGNENIPDSVRNCSISGHRSTSNGSGRKRRSIRQYKRQLELQRESSVGLLKSEPTSSCA